MGGANPEVAYRKYVKDGIVTPQDPFKSELLREWDFGSEDFLRRMVSLAEGGDAHRHHSTSRRIDIVSVAKIINATAAAHELEIAEYAMFRSVAAGRDMAVFASEPMPARSWTHCFKENRSTTMERSGMRWTLEGTRSMLHIRAAYQSDYWELFHRERQSKLTVDTHPNDNLLATYNPPTLAC